MELIETLRATLTPDRHDEAERKLKTMCKMSGFASSLLDVISEVSVDLPVKQAAGICLKNLLQKHWENTHKFTIHDQDKAIVRSRIIEALTDAPRSIGVQLGECVRVMIKVDFPNRWPEVAEIAKHYLQCDAPSMWMTAVLCISQIARNAEDQEQEEFCRYQEYMGTLFPLCLQRSSQLLSDQSQQAVVIQKEVFKMVRSLIKSSLFMRLVSVISLAQWMEIFILVLWGDERNEPKEDDTPERSEVVYWKLKKWALHIIIALHESYESAAGNNEQSQQLYTWFVQTFSEGIVAAVFGLLEAYSVDDSMPPAILVDCLKYLTFCVEDERLWLKIKQDMGVVLKEVIFPMLCHSEKDEELWGKDPIEYISMKFIWFEDFTFEPLHIAHKLLHEAVGKSEEMLGAAMGIIKRILSPDSVDSDRVKSSKRRKVDAMYHSSSVESSSSQKAGALYLIAAIAEILVEKVDSIQVQNLILGCIFQELKSPHGYLRAAACWTLEILHVVDYNFGGILPQVAEAVLVALCHDSEVAVNTQASYTFESFIMNSEDNIAIFQPYIRDIMFGLVRILPPCNKAGILNVIKEMCLRFREEIVPVTVEICTNYANEIVQNLQQNSDSKVVATMLSNLGLIANMVKKDIGGYPAIEHILIALVLYVFNNKIAALYEGMFEVLVTLTSHQISPNTWQAFHCLYEFLQNADNLDYFEDVAQVLYNFITVDMKAFSADARHLDVVDNVCQTVLLNNTSEDAELDAIKLLQTILLQYKGQVDSVVPTFTNLALGKLMGNMVSPKLRIGYLQLLIAALYQNPSLFLGGLKQQHNPEASDTIADVFLEQWFRNFRHFKGNHGRKLCVLGLCSLIQSPAELRSPFLLRHASKIIPVMVTFLKCQMLVISAQEMWLRSYDLQDLYPSFETVGRLPVFDFDENNNESQPDAHENCLSNDNVSNNFETVIDRDEKLEFMAFQNVICSVQSCDPKWFGVLASELTDMREDIQDIWNFVETRAKEE